MASPFENQHQLKITMLVDLWFSGLYVEAIKNWRSLEFILKK
jgi:hypothetical protein